MMIVSALSGLSVLLLDGQTESIAAISLAVQGAVVLTGSGVGPVKESSSGKRSAIDSFEDHRSAICCARCRSKSSNRRRTEAEGVPRCFHSKSVFAENGPIFIFYFVCLGKGGKKKFKSLAF